MLPTWLQPIENVFRSVERWFTQGRFLVLMGGAVVVMALLTGLILSRRHDAGWLTANCGPLQWSRASMPIKVYADSTFPDDWMDPLAEGMRLIDPSGKLLTYDGRLVPPATQPEGSILIEQWNDEAHGHTEPTYRNSDCTLQHVVVSLPTNMLPGKGRMRAAAHELGHGLGLSHSDWETHVMYPTASTLFPVELSATEKKLLDDAYLR